MKILKSVLGFGIVAVLTLTLPLNHAETNQIPITDYHQHSSIRKQLDCLAKNVYYEAGNQRRIGKEAVAIVTMNRVDSGLYPNNVCSVVYQRYQFSWTTKKHLAKIPLEAYNDAYDVAVDVMTKKVANPKLKGCLYYHSVTVRPSWIKRMKVALIIGPHIFYKHNDRK